MLVNEKLLEVIAWKLLIKNLISDKEYERMIELLRKEIDRRKIGLINSKMN
jgi:hypothetical protein